MARLSIVVPVWNCNRFIKSLLDSIDQQTVDPFEVIFIDGYSTDGTAETVKAYSALKQSVRVLQRPPKGIYNAWNDGVASTMGDFVHIACGDDILRPDLVESFQKSSFHFSSRDGFLSWEIDVIDSNDLVVSHAPDWNLKAELGIDTREPSRIDGRLEALLLFLFRAYRLSFMSLAFRKKVWAEKPFRTDLGPSADVEWLAEAFLRGWSTISIPQTLAAWRVHDASATGGARRSSRLQAQLALREQMLDRLCSGLQLSAGQGNRLKTISPAIDVYDYLNAIRESRGPAEICSNVVKAISTAGVDFIPVLLRKLGLLEGWHYRRPLDQLQAVLGERPVSNFVSPLP